MASQCQKLSEMISNLDDRQVCLPTEEILAESIEWTSDYNRNGWKSLKRLCSREYWKRVWIIQEIVLAQNVVFRCGKMQLNWQSLSDLFLMLSSTDRRGRSLNPVEYQIPSFIEVVLNSPASSILKLRREYNYNKNSLGPAWQGFPLADALITSGNARCSERKDKIYGLLGLADTNSLDLSPDYQLNISQLYKMMMAQKDLWNGYHIVRFSSFTQSQLGGLSWEKRLHEPQCSSVHIYRTVTRSHG